jgi:glycosyltransferase involved in cell wall biosynthesis
MRLLKEMGVNAHLHIFGGGMLEEDVKTEMSKNGVEDCITLHGYADSYTAVAFLKACDVLLIPSRIESIPIIFSDAVTCGIPMVATEVGDLGVLVRKHRIGEVVQPNSARMLAEGIRSVLAKGRSTFSAGALEASLHFDVRASAVNYLQTVTKNI